MPDSSAQSPFHVILVEPAESLNIGSVARAMSNFGVSNLHLVAPRGYDRARAGVTACWGEGILDSARRWNSLEEAIAPMEDVVGFSSRSGKNLPAITTLEAFAAELPRTQASRIALLFGPEDTGLRREHLEKCRAIVRIPTSEENPSLNLAQSTVLALYELTKPAHRPALIHAEPHSNAASFQVLDGLIDDVLKRSEFLNAGTPAEVPGLVKSLFRRTQPSEREMQILLGMMSRISKRLG